MAGKPAILIGALLAALLAATGTQAQTAAQTSARATAGASASILAPASISVTRNLSFSITPQALSTGLTFRASVVNGVNANVVLTGSQAASIAVPATFEVARVGGSETLTVRTVGAVTAVTGSAGGQIAGVASGGFFSEPIAVVGALDAGQLSFSIGGLVTAVDDLTPGQYQGVLTVIAQYN